MAGAGGRADRSDQGGGGGHAQHPARAHRRNRRHDRHGWRRARLGHRLAPARCDRSGDCDLDPHRHRLDHLDAAASWHLAAGDGDDDGVRGGVDTALRAKPAGDLDTSRFLCRDPRLRSRVALPLPRGIERSRVPPAASRGRRADDRDASGGGSRSLVSTAAAARVEESDRLATCGPLSRPSFCGGRLRRPVIAPSSSCFQARESP